jgi:hypothetical protein
MADTDNTIFTFNGEVNTVIFVLVSYHKSFHQTVLLHSFSTPVLCSGHSRFQINSGYLVFWLRLSYFSQPLGKKYSESMIVHYSISEALLSDLPDESFKITLSFNKHTLDANADMVDITVMCSLGGGPACVIGIL